MKLHFKSVSVNRSPELPSLLHAARRRHVPRELVKHVHASVKKKDHARQKRPRGSRGAKVLSFGRTTSKPGRVLPAVWPGLLCSFSVRFSRLSAAVTSNPGYERSGGPSLLLLPAPRSFLSFACETNAAPILHRETCAVRARKREGVRPRKEKGEGNTDVRYAVRACDCNETLGEFPYFVDSIGVSFPFVLSLSTRKLNPAGFRYWYSANRVGPVSTSVD